MRSAPAVQPSFPLGWAVAILLTVGLCLIGCDDPIIEEYEAPKDPVAPAEDHTGHDHGSDDHAKQAAPAQPGWQAPDGWVLQPGGGMALATYTVGQADQPARMTVTPLTGTGGGLLLNINRWRGQVGLDVVASIDDQPSEVLTVLGQPVDMFDLAGQTRRILVVIVTQPDRTWYFKIDGPTTTVEQQKQAFKQLVESLRFAAPAGESGQAQEPGKDT
jgi:hypothetical protein